MKIKRLTAAFAVAAMAAGFTLASPMMSAQALANPWQLSRTQPAVTTYNAANANASDYAQTWNLAGTNSLLKNDTTVIKDASGNNAYINKLVTDTVSHTWVVQSCDLVAIPDTDVTATVVPITDVGTCTLNSDSTITYTPALNYGVTQPETFYIRYSMWDSTNLPDNDPGIWGFIKVTVTTPAAQGCTATPAECLNYSVQAWTKTDKKATSVSVPVIAANIETPATKKAAGFGFIPADKAASWKLIDPIDGKAIVPVSSSGDSLSATVMAGLIKQSSDGKTVVFTPPADWSGVVIYQYTIAMYNGINLVNLANTDSVSAPSPIGNVLTITVQPTLTAPDAITSDPNTAVTVPLLGKGTLPIIGSSKFQNASCVFASNGKTKDSASGSIKNAGSSANPVFTPAQDFQGSVDLSCTVQDTFGITSNAVTVTIQVGTPAPAPADTTAAPAAPSCTTDCGTLVSTGGSLATPMTSGLTAVLLLVAAGAGVLVIRRRTALVG